MLLFYPLPPTHMFVCMCVCSCVCEMSIWCSEEHICTHLSILKCIFLIAIYNVLVKVVCHSLLLLLPSYSIPFLYMALCRDPTLPNLEKSKFFFWDKFSLYSQSFPGLCSVDQAGRWLRNFLQLLPECRELRHVPPWPIENSIEFYNCFFNFYIKHWDFSEDSKNCGWLWVVLML